MSAIPPGPSEPRHHVEHAAPNPELPHEEHLQMFNAQIDRSRSVRGTKLALLDREKQEEYNQLEQEIAALKDPYTEFLHLSLTPDRSAQQDESLDALTAMLETRTDEIFTQYIKYLLNPRALVGYQLSPETFEIFQESTLNAYVNRHTYVKEIRANVKSNLHEIARYFGWGKVKLKSIKILQGETHHYGKCVAKLKLSEEGREEDRWLIYKPRSAAIDQEVIRTFDRINQLDEDDRSDNLPLPTYRIFELPRHTASVWEFIPGKNLTRKSKNPKSAGRFVMEQAERYPQLRRKVMRMDAILSNMHIGDLHGENVIIKRYGEREPDVVPIDLENLLFPVEEGPVFTSLDAYFPHTHEEIYSGLTEAELQLTSQFLDQTHDLITRYIPIATSKLARDIFNYRNTDMIARDILQIVRNDGYETIIDDQAIANEILFDILNNDVPYLTQLSGNIYYGLPERNIQIATRGG